jgi:hypothetical protein
MSATIQASALEPAQAILDETVLAGEPWMKRLAG